MDLKSIVGMAKDLDRKGFFRQADRITTAFMKKEAIFYLLLKYSWLILQPLPIDVKICVVFWKVFHHIVSEFTEGFYKVWGATIKFVLR